MFTKIYDFSDPDDWTFDIASVVIANDVCSLLNLGIGNFVVTNPFVETKFSFGADSLATFVAATTIINLDDIKFIIFLDGVKKWFNGTWVNSNGTFAESNSAADINTNIGTLLPVGSDFKIKIGFFLHSETGSTTPSISDVSIGYDYTNEKVTWHGGNNRGEL